MNKPMKSKPIKSKPIKSAARRHFAPSATAHLADPLQTGIAHHRAGRLAQAAACYAAIPTSSPQHTDALNLSGVIARQQGDLTTSERLIKRAIAINPGIATYHHHLGRTCEQQQRPADAIAHYRKAIALNPSDFDSLRPLAQLLLARGKTAEAAAFFDRVLTLDPNSLDAYFALGGIHKSTRDFAAALPYYHRAVALFPHSTDSHFNLALALYEAGHFADAIPVFQQLLAINPKDHEAHDFLGQCFHEIVDYNSSRACYLKALELNPDFSAAIENLGALCMDIGELTHAEMLFRRALELTPDSLTAQTNLGVLFSRKGMHLEAIQFLRSVLTVNPRQVHALCSLGFLLFNLGDEAGAESCYRLALEAQPTSAVALFNLSSSLLTAGRFAEGWEAYEMRWQVRQFMAERQTLSQPRWTGEDLTGRRLYIHSEQGFGDTLQFMRYAILLAQQGVQVIFAVQPVLLQLLQDLHPSIQVIAKGTEPLPPFDFFCPLLSLPRVFQSNLTNLPTQTPYLQPRPQDLPHWSQRIASPHLRVGIVWSGNPLHTRDRIRSIPWPVFSRLLQIPGVTFYSLQKGSAVEHLPTADHIVDLNPELHNFTDTAAAIAQLDLVIAVDTAVAHLAGALGKPVWILNSQASDWRWLKDRTDSPWYPTARLFRQSILGNWDQVIADVHHALADMAATRQPWTDASAIASSTLIPHHAGASA